LEAPELERMEPCQHPEGTREVRELAVRLVFEHEQDYESQWAAIRSIAEKSGMTSETLRTWVRQAERDGGRRNGVTTEDRNRMRELERENKELRRANEMADSTGGRNELCKLLRWCHVSEGLARTSVETPLNPTEVDRADLGEVDPP
jgi:transposase